MKTIFSSIAFLFVLSCSTSPVINKEKENECSKYSCPMHPDHTSSKPAECPQCGMQMEPVHADSTGN